MDHLVDLLTPPASKTEDDEKKKKAARNGAVRKLHLSIKAITDARANNSDQPQDDVPGDAGSALGTSPPPSDFRSPIFCGRKRRATIIPPSWSKKRHRVDTTENTALPKGVLPVTPLQRNAATSSSTHAGGETPGTAAPPPVRRSNRQRVSTSNVDETPARTTEKRKAGAMEAEDLHSMSLHTEMSIQDCWDQMSKIGFGIQGRPTTEFLGWRRLTLAEIVYLEEGSFFILVIPASARNEDAEIVKCRNNLLTRIRAIVYQINKSHFDRFGVAQRGKEINSFLERRNGIQSAQQNKSIKLPCVVSVYPNRAWYANPTYAKAEVKLHIGQGAGIGISLLDYPSRVKLDLKFLEINSIQCFVPHMRGDVRPRITLSDRRSLDNYCDELEDKLKVVEGDIIQSLELLVAYEGAKSRIAQRTLNKSMAKAEKDLKQQIANREEITCDEITSKQFSEALSNELDAKKKENFAITVPTGIRLQHLWGYIQHD